MRNLFSVADMGPVRRLGERQSVVCRMGTLRGCTAMFPSFATLAEGMGVTSVIVRVRWVLVQKSWHILLEKVLRACDGSCTGAPDRTLRGVGEQTFLKRTYARLF